jgi:GAF domain-containing protein
MHEDGPFQRWDAEANALLNLTPDHDRLLQTVVHTARAIFAAQASSIFLLDPTRRHLVFEAVSGAGEDHLIGTRVPLESGLAGWVMLSAQPIAVDDVDTDPLFARGVAESTGYVPTTIIAAPLLVEGEAIGVIEVLDRANDSRGELSDLDILGLFAGQAAIGLQMLRRGRLADDLSEHAPGGQSLLAQALKLLRGCDEQQLEKAVRVLTAVLEP